MLEHLHSIGSFDRDVEQHDVRIALRHLVLSFRQAFSISAHGQVRLTVKEFSQALTSDWVILHKQNARFWIFCWHALIMLISAQSRKRSKTDRCLVDSPNFMRVKTQATQSR